jgi:RHS repeat-associated protein
VRDVDSTDYYPLMTDLVAAGGASGFSATAYQYDAENRLIAIGPTANPADGMLKFTFAYDYLGRRIRKQLYTYNGSTSTWDLTTDRKWIYDGWRPIVELDGTTDTVLRTYTWGLDLSGSLEAAGGIGGLLAVHDETVGAGEDYVYTYDHLGNVGQLVDLDAASATAAVVAHYEYDPYGNVVTQSGPYADTNPFRFSTKYHDAETGLVYYGYRYYSPRLGRWLTRDPIGEAGGLHLYAYVYNLPGARVDALGLDWFDDLSNFVAGAGDSLSFGLSRLARRGISRVVWGDWDSNSDPGSNAYFAGEVTEVAVEIVVTAGGATLRYAARRTVREAIEGGARKRFRKEVGAQTGTIAHHVNPIKGHGIGNALARYPLPFRWAAQGGWNYWNLTLLPNRAAHLAAHRWIMRLEAIDRLRELTLIGRQTTNRILWYLETNVPCRCWSSLSVSGSVQTRMDDESGELERGHSVIAVAAASGVATKEIPWWLPAIVLPGIR